MAKYRKIAEEIEAIKFTKDNIKDILDFINIKNIDSFSLTKNLCVITVGNRDIRCMENDYIIKKNSGVFDVWNTEFVEKTYEKIDDEVEQCSIFTDLFDCRSCRYHITDSYNHCELNLTK